MRAVLLAALLLLQATAPRQSQTPRQSTAVIAVRSASIQGVVQRTDNTVLANARVELFLGPDTPFVTHTDGGGRFSFPNLAPGAYRARVTRDGYLRQEYGARALDMKGTWITLVAGQRMTDLNFTLAPAATIEGVVADDHGEALPDVLIQALRPSYDLRGNPILVPKFFALTDDYGHYRLFWIDPAAYVVSATATPDILKIFGSPPNVNRNRSPQGFAPTYHTGVTDPTGIEPLKVAIGEEPQGLSFHLVRNPQITIRGSVLGTAKQIAGAGLTLMPAIRATAQPLNRLRANKDGQFEIQHVTPGKHVLSARADDGARGEVLLEVSGLEDIAGVEINLIPAVTLNGQVYLEGQSALTFLEVQVALLPLDPDRPPAPPAAIETNGHFSLKTVETGEYLLDVRGLPEDAYLAAAKMTDVDVLAKGIVIAGSGKEPLEILLRVDGGRVNVTVNDTKDKPIPGARVVLVPDAGRQHPDQYRTAIVEDDGRFRLRAVPPGDYTAYAWEHIEPNAYLNADFMKPYAERGTAIHIAPGTNPPLTLTALAP